MDTNIEAHRITDVATLERLYGEPSGAAVEKEVNYIHAHYRTLIAASPFVVLATGGPEGLDTSPRGDAAGFVVVEDEKTLLIPDRRGNNRIGNLRNNLQKPPPRWLFFPPKTGKPRGKKKKTAGTNRAGLAPPCVNGKKETPVRVGRAATVIFFSLGGGARPGPPTGGRGAGQKGADKPRPGKGGRGRARFKGGKKKGERTTRNGRKP